MSQPFIFDVTDESFERDVIQRSHQVPVVVDFWAPWCGPCKTLGPILEGLAQAAQGAFVLAKINTDEHNQVARVLKVRGIPAVKAFVKGQLVQEFVGLKPQAEIIQWLEALSPSPQAQRAAQIEAALAAKDWPQAKQLIEHELAQRPGESKLTLSLARVAVGMQDLALARQLLESIPEDVGVHLGEPYARLWLGLEAAAFGTQEQLQAAYEREPDSIQAAWALAISLAAEGHYEPALELLLSIVRRDRDFGQDAGRLTMLKIFNLMGMADPRTLRWQQRLGQVMYV